MPTEFPQIGESSGVGPTDKKASKASEALARVYEARCSKVAGPIDASAKNYRFWRAGIGKAFMSGVWTLLLEASSSRRTKHLFEFRFECPPSGGSPGVETYSTQHFDRCIMPPHDTFDTSP